MASSLIEENITEGRMGGKPSEHDQGKLQREVVFELGLKQVVQNRDRVRSTSQWKEWDEKRLQK